MKDDQQRLKKLESQMAAMMTRIADLESRLSAVEKQSPVPRFALPNPRLKRGQFDLPTDDSAKIPRPTRRREPPRI